MWLTMTLAWRGCSPQVDAIVASRQAPALSSETVRMTIRTAQGTERVRLYERHHQGVTTTYEVLAPADLAGIRLVQRADLHRIWLPALKTSWEPDLPSQGRWLGSSLTFEDLRLLESIDGVHWLAGQTPQSWVIETRPRRGSAYPRIRWSVDQDTGEVHRLELYEWGALHKLVEIQPVRVVVTDLVSGTETWLEASAR